MKEENMDNSQPLTPESFVNKNLLIIKNVFPALVPDESTSGQDASVKPKGVPSLIAGLENQVWQTMGNDPVLQRLGREKYNALPEGQRLKLLEDAIVLLDAAQEADKFLKNKGG